MYPAEIEQLRVECVSALKKYVELNQRPDFNSAKPTVKWLTDRLNFWVEYIAMRDKFMQLAATWEVNQNRERIQ